MDNKNKWSYNTNMMGPFGLWWFEENNIPYIIKIINNKFTNFKDVKTKTYESWYGGRIDCYCANIKDPDFDPFGYSLRLPIMKSESYGLFSNWLEEQSTDKLVNEEYLFKKFEKESNHKIVFFKKPKYMN